MITVYRFKGKYGSVPADYIPCLIGTDERGDEAYFETLGETEAHTILETKRSKWFSHPVQIVAIRYQFGLKEQLGYVMADELMTAGVAF